MEKEMEQQTCVRLIDDWFAMRGIKADAESLAAWLYTGGDTIRPQTPPRPTYQWLFEHLSSAVREVATWPAWKRNGSTMQAIPQGSLYVSCAICGVRLTAADTTPCRDDYCPLHKLSQS